jgi:hypothetical protein
LTYGKKKVTWDVLVNSGMDDTDFNSGEHFNEKTVTTLSAILRNKTISCHSRVVIAINLSNDIINRQFVIGCARRAFTWCKNKKSFYMTLCDELAKITRDEVLFEKKVVSLNNIYVVEDTLWDKIAETGDEYQFTPSYRYKLDAWFNSLASSMLGENPQVAAEDVSWISTKIVAESRGMLAARSDKKTQLEELKKLIKEF